MKKEFYVISMTLFCLITVGAGAAQEEGNRALKRHVRKAFQITSAVFSTAGTVRLMRSFRHWDKFFLRPQLGIVPANIEQHIKQADSQKLGDRGFDTMLLGLCGILYKALPTLTKQDGIFLPVAFTMHTVYGVTISAAHFRMICDKINRRFMSPQRDLLVSECIFCAQNSRQLDLVVPCENASHPVCAECYSDRIEWADHYQCPSCTRVIPAQEITNRPVSLYDKMCRLSTGDRAEIRKIVFFQFMVCVLLYLSLQGVLDS